MKKGYLIFPLLAVLIFSGAGCISFSGAGSVGDGGGVFKSADKGESWQQKVAVASVKSGVNIGNLNVASMAFDPQDPKTIYLGTVESGLFYTIDGAESWMRAGGLSVGKITAIAVDTKDKCTVYGAVSNRIYKTTNCTRDWVGTYIDTRAEQIITSLAVEPSNPSTLYAGLSGGDLIKSTDGGASWSVSKRFESQIVSIVVDPNDVKIVYVATYERGVWKTIDAGANWVNVGEKLKEFNGGYSVRRLIMDVSQKNTLILDTRYGLLKTTDGGATWQPLNLLTPPESISIYSLALSPQNGNEIYYGTDSTLYKSVDGGVKWITKKLPTTRAASYLLVDPSNANVVYLGTMAVKK